MSASPHEKPSLETLLKFKRHERPSPEFWEAFDRSLAARLTRSTLEREARARARWRLWRAVGAGVGISACAAAAWLVAAQPFGAFDAANPPDRTTVALAAPTASIAVATATVSDAAPFLPEADAPRVAASMLERAVERETAFAALKADARPAPHALHAAEAEAEGDFLKVMPVSAFAQPKANIRFVAGALPAPATMPGVAGAFSRSY